LLHHTVLLRFVDDATDEQRVAVRDALRARPATFDDDAGYATYRDHPDHVRVVRDLIRPVAAARAAVQFVD
jgi:hypothetical protein